MQQRIEIPLNSAKFPPDSHRTEEFCWEPPNNRFIRQVESATVTFHLPSVPPVHSTPLFIICPGGGYSGVSLDKEGHHVAQWLSDRGIAGAVLKYRMPVPAGHNPLPLPFVDVLRAVAAVSEFSGPWGIDTARIGFMGFSAGGHLAGGVGLRYNELAGRSGLAPENIRPAALALIYPVVSCLLKHGHTGSGDNLLGPVAANARREMFSIQNHVSPSSPPVFLAHSENDGTVPIVHSELLVEACHQYGVPCVFHRVPTGGHGYGLGTPGEDSGSWPAALDLWLRSIGFIPKSEVE